MQDMQAPKGVPIGEFNDTLARPYRYLYKLYQNASLLLLHTTLSLLTSPVIHRKPGPSPYSPPTRRC